MKSKSPLVMLEQLLMLLVFALAAALCLQAFSMADVQAKNSIAEDAAIIEVQKAAEAIKFSGGDMEKAAEILGGSASADSLFIPGESFDIIAGIEASGTELLAQANVRAESPDGQCLFEVTVGWQTGGAE